MPFESLNETLIYNCGSPAVINPFMLCVHVVCFYWWVVTFRIVALSYLSIILNFCYIEITALLVSLIESPLCWKFRYIGIFSILHRRSYCCQSHYNTLVNNYQFCSVMILMQITVNTYSSSNCFN